MPFVPLRAAVSRSGCGAGSPVFRLLQVPPELDVTYTPSFATANAVDGTRGSTARRLTLGLPGSPVSMGLHVRPPSRLTNAPPVPVPAELLDPAYSTPPPPARAVTKAGSPVVGC